MRNTVFTGVATALITPFNQKGVDYENFEKIIEWQIDKKINALVIAGTTGEGPTLTDAEHKNVIKFAVKTSNGRVPIIAGTGSNDTDYAIGLTKYASDVGADGMLVVTPYYNKATQNGLVKMFCKIADNSEKPVILYNVPSRTGVNILPETCLRLAEHKNISGIKEASGDISQIAEIASLTGGEFDIYSGNDDQIVPVLSLGGKGVISVLSNILPEKTCEICNNYFNGSIDESRKLQLELLPLIKALFSEVNPIPVKSAMSKMGYCENYLRLPLTSMEKAHEEVLFELMKRQGINC